MFGKYTRGNVRLPDADLFWIIPCIIIYTPEDLVIKKKQYIF